MSGKNNAERYASLSVEQFQEQWARKMVDIWTDRLEMLGAIRTGSLHGSVALMGKSISQEESQLTLQFLRYGIYVDAGTGRGYTRGNGGDLYFLAKDYRKEHKLGHPRLKKPWFSRSWRISLRIMANYMQRKLGEEYTGLFAALSDGKQ